MSSNRFFGSALAAAIVAIPVLVQGCSDENNPLCCTEFKAGGEINANISSNVQAQVAAQAVADFAGLADGAVDGLTNACRNISSDLGAAPAERDAAESLQGTARMKAYCDLAVKAIGTVKGSGSITIVAEAPRCEASVSAKANCQAKCDVSGKCDIKANPPKCTGGKLQVSCKGSCTAEAGATVQCTGGCTGTCQGSCTVQTGGVECAGRCNGTCKGAAQGGTGEGITASGECKGTCEGTCEVTAPGAQCSGSCSGSCSAECKAEANASVKCDGKCEGDFEPISCEGGKLEGGCQVDAKCDANCDASVKAKAECSPPRLAIRVEGAANAQLLIDTLEANLPLVLQVKGRIQGAVEIGGTVSGNISGFGELKPACIPVLAGAALAAVQDLGETVTVSAQVAGSVGQ